MTSILYINKNDVLLKGFIRHLDPGKYQIKILDLMHGEFIDISTGTVKRLVKMHHSYPNTIKYALRYYCALLFIIRYANIKFDVIHVLNIKRENFYLIPFLRGRCRKIIITVYGRSTYLNLSKRILFAWVYKYVDILVFSNRAVINEFSLANPKVSSGKLTEGIPPVSNIKLSKDEVREINIQEFVVKNNIDRDLIHISCSSTIASNDQHDKVIDAIRNIKWKNKVQLFFLLSYGGTKQEQERIIDKIKNDLADFNVRVFTSFLTNSELAGLRALTDIYINMRAGDQLAGAMLESLYEGALLLSGKWLNYETLDNIGIQYTKVNCFGDLASLVDESIESMDIYKNTYSQANAKKITDTFAVEVVLKKWEELYRVR